MTIILLRSPLFITESWKPNSSSNNKITILEKLTDCNTFYTFRFIESKSSGEGAVPEKSSLFFNTSQIIYLNILMSFLSFCFPALYSSIQNVLRCFKAFPPPPETVNR